MILEDLTTLRSLKHMVDYAAENYGGDPFVTWKTPDGIVSRTYCDFKADTEALGRFFLQNGLQGAHAAIIAANSYAWLAAYFGTANCGSVAVPLAANETPEQLCRLTDFADCSVVFLDKAHAGLVPLLRENAPKVRQVIFLDEAGDGDALLLGDILAQYAGSYPDEPDGDAMCAILFTSGTTGFPKGVMLTHRNFVLSATSVHVTCPTHSLLCVLPLSHAFCFTAVITKGIAKGKEIFLNDSLPNILENMRLFKPESTAVVPQLAKKLMAGALKFAEARPDLSENEAVKAFFGGRIIDIISGGAPLESELAIRFDRTGVPVLNGYGMTECAPIIANNATFCHRAGSVGKPIPCMQTVIRGGELLVKGPTVFRGYYKNEEATAEAFTSDGYFKTGDLGRFDNDGFLYLTGRSKNLILLDNGENVSAEQFEDRFANEHAVKEVVCYGEGNAIVAELFLDTDFLKANAVADTDAYLIALLQRVNSGLAAFQRISRYVVRPVPFRRNASMKIIRNFEHTKAQRRIAPPVTPTQKKVCAAAADLLQIGEVGIDDNFFALGGSSLSAVEFALALNIEPQLVYDKPFLGLLAAAIDEMHKDAGTENENEVNDWIKETRGGTRTSPAKHILLTGATGFLGAHVLRALLERDVKLWVLVRSRERFLRRMAYYFGDLDVSGVQLVLGDVEQPLLGLTEALYDSLASQIDTVVHTAANVHHAGDYADLARTNVEGTKHVIAFAKRANAVLAHTSTTSLHGAGTVIENHKHAVLDEGTLYIGQHYADNVYIHSKYEAERAVLQARREGLQANIFRMGNLTWRQRDGVFQPNAADNGFLHRVRAILKLGLVNDNMDKFPMDLTAIDEAAFAVAALTLQPQVNEIYHILNPNYLPTREMFALLGVPCREASTAETIETVMANNGDRDVHVFEFYSLISARSENVELDTAFTVRALQRCGFAWTKPDARYLRLGNHCLGFDAYVPAPMRRTGGTMTYIQKLFLGVLRDAQLPKSETAAAPGCIASLPDFAAKLGMRRPLVLSFDAALAMPSVKAALSRLAGYETFTAIAGEPTLPDADRILDAYEAADCDGVIAIGGGSVLDLAKITALRAGNPGADIDDICKVDSEAHRCVPFLAAPTTAGTGSEVTLFAVITDGEGKKKPFASTKFLPDVILLDPALTLTVPQKMTAHTAIDALSHIVEASVSLYAPAFAEDLAEAPQAAADIFRALPAALAEPQSLEARTALLLASHKAGIAFRRASTGYIHAIAHRLGEECHAPHGLAIAAVFTDVLRASRPFADAALETLAKSCGCGGSAEDFLAAVDALIEGAQLDFSNLRIASDRLDEVVRKVQDEARITGYPRPFSDSEVAQMVKRFVKV